MASSAVGIASTHKANQNSEPPIDSPAEEGDEEARDCHPHCAGVDREAHGRGRHSIGLRQRRQNRLGRKQIDHCEESGQANDDRPAEHTRGIAIGAPTYPSRVTSGT